MKLLKTNLEGIDFWYREDDKFIGQRIALGKYENYETKLLLNQINTNSVVVDVGANIGYYTCLLAKKVKKVYAMEPEEENFTILKKNVEANSLENVVLIKAAAGEKKEIKYLIKNSKNFGDHHLGDKKGVAVKCLRLDDILMSEQNISLIKIDVQGWEPAVIEGGKQIIKRDLPILFLEFWPEGIRRAKLNEKIMIEYLKSKYKNIWEIDQNLDICRKIKNEIKIDKKTRYVDLWMKNSTTIKDYIDTVKDIKIKKLIKNWLGFA